MVSRRAVLKAAAGLPLAAVLADPVLARAAAAGLETVSLTLPNGRTVHAALALPAARPAGAVLLIHEWWGLNDQIKAVGAELAREGYVALAADLMNGRVAATPDEAQALTRSVKPDEAIETLTGWLGWLRTHPASTGKRATIGWCFGGGWSLRASLATPVDGTVIYYGELVDDPAVLARLAGPVLGHFATQDQWITRPKVERFTAAMDAAGKRYQVYWYDANHAFANPTGASYDQADAQLAWRRTLAFLHETVA